MSWRERLDNIQFTITTGDEKQYAPLWKNGEKSIEFNVAKYDFINVEKSFVDRKEAKSAKFPLIFWFQGDDNIDQADEFEISAKDKRAWTIDHPFYGIIKGQPTNLRRVDTNYNVTEVNIDFWESLTDDYPSSNVSVKDEVISRAEVLNETALTFLVENSVPQTEDINKISDLVGSVSSKFEASKDLFNEYNAKVSKAVALADNLVTDAQSSLAAFQDIINFPANFVDSVKNKISSYVDSFESMKESIDNLFSKYSFESNASSVIAGMCLTAINSNETDFITRDDIEAVNDQLLTTYNEYLQIIDENQVEIYDTNNAWVPNLPIQLQLQNLVTYTSNSLFLLSFDARQERSFQLTKDSNLILLTHKFMGLDAEDKNIETFRIINNIRTKELYKIKQGRVVKYFV